MKICVYLVLALFALYHEVVPTYEFPRAIGATGFAGVAFVQLALLATTMLFFALAHFGARRILARRSR